MSLTNRKIDHRGIGRIATTILALTVSAWAAGILSAEEDEAVERVLHKEIVINAPVSQVWRCWTDSAEMAQFFSPDSKIELRIGGAYECYMGMKEPDESGGRGSEGCKVLSFIPNELLAFEWTFPPAVPTLRKAGVKTQVVLQFEAVDASRTRVLFDQLGWQQGADWDEGYRYFDLAWGHVLGALKGHAESMADMELGAGTPSSTRTWQDGVVEVHSTEGANQKQVFEMEIPVPVDEVWRLLATTEGLVRLGATEPRVELKPGGAWAFWPGSPNKVLAYVPGTVLSTRGSAPPKFPNVQREGTWSAFFFKPVGSDKTRLILSVVGWRPGEKEWDEAYEYFLKANPMFLTSVHRVLTEGS